MVLFLTVLSHHKAIHWKRGLTFFDGSHLFLLNDGNNELFSWKIHDKICVVEAEMFLIQISLYSSQKISNFRNFPVRNFQVDTILSNMLLWLKKNINHKNNTKYSSVNKSAVTGK